MQTRLDDILFFLCYTNGFHLFLFIMCTCARVLTAQRRLDILLFKVSLKRIEWLWSVLPRSLHDQIFC